ncbi:MAG: U32 family peptidase C-terminal domain-containing protein [Oscillospiraceae bacterium]|nr:U32 family peptidase C-terminal domain-containing protein [Oscillospiraceae bacterium]
MKKVELLLPAGDFSKLKTAFKYGADAVYFGGAEFSLRTAADNFSIADMERAAELVGELGKKIYLAANIIPHNSDIAEFRRYIKEIRHIPLSGIIVSDLGMFDIAREELPDVELHVSTQANICNYQSAKMWHKLGASRVILARELSLDEIAEIRENVPETLELEAFVHGAMCISYSGRCLLSNYMTNRDGNSGNCAQPCRWNYHLMEEKRPGEYLPVYENERGTYIFNSKDLCMIEHVDKLIECGLSSFKIEGRVKNEYYVAAVASAYRDAIDTYYKDPQGFKTNPDWLAELRKVSHRDYTTGFYFNRPGSTEQHYHSSSYIREYDLAAVAQSYDSESGLLTVLQKNRFFKGDTVEFLRPFGKFHIQTIEEMFDENGESIEVANKPQSVIKIKVDGVIEADSIMRKQKN